MNHQHPSYISSFLYLSHIALSTNAQLIKDLTGWIFIYGRQIFFYCSHSFNGIYNAKLSAICRGLLFIQCHPNSATFSQLTAQCCADCWYLDT